MGIAKVTAQGALRRLTRELAAEGEIQHSYSAHDFRHYFAVKEYRLILEVYAVKKELGHATASVTEVY